MTPISRRAALCTGLAAAALPIVPRMATAAEAVAARRFRLVTGTATVRLNGPEWPETEVWAYNGQVPGPEIRVRQGERLRVTARNGLTQSTTVHWHGLRVPNAMDGVPGLTQEPIPPRGSFVYEFAAEDAGTFWYHPHFKSAEQVGRGLAGPLIVEERTPPAVDRELTWVLDDWRLDSDGAIAAFGQPHDMSHAGRLGNSATLNGGSPETIPVRAGERLRLRLVNVANARTFALAFEGHEPWVVALDGHPVAPFRAPDGRVVITAAQRVDLVLDMGGAPGSRHRVIDGYYPSQRYKLVELAYAEAAPLRTAPPGPPPPLAANPLAEPDLAAAERHEVVLQGGAMGGMAEATLDGRRMGIRALAEQGKFWAMNGRVFGTRFGDPLFAVGLGRSCRLVMRNDTAFEHPMHLHGHSFRVLGRNGEADPRRPWRDTVLVRPRETVEVAFVADNPGDWMFHCHVLEHQAAGMMATIRVG